MTPEVSIVIPLFNRGDLIADTIQSVVDQSCLRWELCLVDDHSTDNTLSIASEFAKTDSRIHCWSRESQVKGAPSCRNEGLVRATSNHVIFLDSDDLLAPNCVQQRVSKFKENPNCDFLVFAMQLFDQEIGDSQDVWCFRSDDYLGEFLDCPLWQTSCPIWNREFLRQIGGWKEGLPSWQDWELHVRALCAKPRFEVFPADIDCFYRRGNTGRISDGNTIDSKQLNTRVTMFFETAALLENAGEFNEKRKFALTRQITKLIVLLSLYGRHDEAGSAFDELVARGFIPREHVAYLHQYLKFEANQFWKKPMMTKTIRRLLKFIHHCRVPQYIHRTGPHRLRLGARK